ncbi:hypothetical protein B0H15DRAFT_800797 [Mycena belliarum]|uniref:Zn(2)-C6 fungal-type domain-containing protein n=1 Tax=Mycena belliarum TaxID=1033014 RepID=A0AAD6XS43_9AGAR|nr:hypothetical protein B0H15DRAFT_800797 [Mycena belliae]
MQRPGPQLPSIRQLHPYLPPTPVLPSSLYAAESPTSEHDFADADSAERDEEPPKKKRRRQALSCTECKRRKIRCDRTEKYVSRAEHDALRARVDALEAYFTRIAPGNMAPLAPAQVETKRTRSLKDTARDSTRRRLPASRLRSPSILTHRWLPRIMYPLKV